MARLHPGTSRGADYMRGFTWGVKGEEVVMANLNKQLEGVKSRSMKGLIMAAAFVRNETEKTPPLTPVDTGNMRASWFVVTPDRVVAGSGTHQFKGKKAAEMLSNHGSTVAEGQGIVKSQSMGDKKVLMMGYSANYSGFVHEMVDMKYPSRSESGPKWLESAIKRNTGKIVQIVKDNAQIKG